MEKLELGAVKAHNMELAKGGIGKEDDTRVRHTVEETLGEFCKQITETRLGLAVDKKGNKLRAKDVSFDDALNKVYGFKDTRQFLRCFDLSPGEDSLSDVSAALGMHRLDKSTVEEFLIDHSKMRYADSAPVNTQSVDSSFRFIIPEIFMSAVRTGYQHASLHQNWIATTQNMAQQKVTMPMILRGDGMPSRVNEGANIPFGSVKFGKKDLNIFKIGTGFAITDEMVMASSIDMIYTFLQEVGNDMAIGADALAFSVLVNGEQADLSESAPVVGVNVTANGFTYADIKRVFTRMRRLGTPATRLITSEDDAINITGIDRFEGFNGDTRLATIRSIVGVPDAFDIDAYITPANQMLYLNPQRAMMKLTYRGFMTERRRNPQNQTEEMFMSDWINFGIINRSARVIQSKAVTYASTPFPAYMDIDARINQAFSQL